MGWLKQPNRASLLSILKDGDELTTKTLTKVLDGVLFKSEFKQAATGSTVDHGELDGLTGDDHPQYLLASSATSRTYFTTSWGDLTDGGDTILHGHDVTGLTNWPTINYAYVSGIDAGTDVSAAELEELTDASDTTLHGHDVTGLTNWPTIDYSYVSGNDAATDITAAELEELSDGSDTELHIHDGLYYEKAETAQMITYFCDGTSAAVTVYLPDAAAAEGYIYNIKAINVDNDVTLTPNGTDDLEGANTSIVLDLLECIKVQSDGTAWWIV